MTSNKPFRNAREKLNTCQLRTPITDKEASVLGIMLATSEPWLTLNMSARSLENYFIQEDLALHRYLVSVENQIAGVIGVRNPWLRGPYIEFLGLDEKYQGLGIGQELLQWAEKEARLEFKNLWVVTSSFNHKALQFYQRHGFNKIGTLEGLVSPHYDEILLRKCWD